MFPCVSGVPTSIFARASCRGVFQHSGGGPEAGVEQSAIEFRFLDSLTTDDQESGRRPASYAPGTRQESKLCPIAARVDRPRCEQLNSPVRLRSGSWAPSLSAIDAATRRERPVVCLMIWSSISTNKWYSWM